MEILSAFLLGILEGLTEFIPVSSTGHLIVAGHLLDFEGPKASTFEIFIQLGAILAVLFLFKERFFDLLRLRERVGFRGARGIMLLFLTTLPAMVFGALAYSTIKSRLFNPATVAIGLAVGGLAILATERWLPGVKKSGLDSLDWKDALLVGLFQCLAMWPGMSRSACTILGGMLIGVDRRTAVEYSFFAAVPVMLAAVTLDLYKNIGILESGDVPIFGIGFLVAFFSAWLAIKFFLRIVANHDLSAFGWYRLAVAPLIYFLIS